MGKMIYQKYYNAGKKFDHQTWCAQNTITQEQEISRSHLDWFQVFMRKANHFSSTLDSKLCLMWIGLQKVNKKKD